MNPRWLLGRTIVAVEMNPSPDGRGGTVHDPVIFFDNGACVYFFVEATEIGIYGVDVRYVRKSRKPNPSAARVKR